MAKPKSMAVGNTLTLVKREFGACPDGGKWEWREGSTNGIGVPRVIIRARSEFVEVGSESSQLEYPKASEFTETPASDGKPALLTLKRTRDDRINRQTTCVLLEYEVTFKETT